MINAEGTLFRLIEITGRTRLVERLLRSELVWRASGATYLTSVIATTGSYGSPESYIGSMSARMTRLRPWFSQNDVVLEFGSGIGGNLLAVSPWVSRGFGIDINPWFTSQAERLRRRFGVENVSFHCYDGRHLPAFGRLDLVFAFGPFERIPKASARSYLTQLARALVDGGHLISHFLTDRDQQAQFARLLGPDAYTWWDTVELTALLGTLGLVEVSRSRDFPSSGVTLVLEKRRQLPEGNAAAPGNTKT